MKNDKKVVEYCREKLAIICYEIGLSPSLNMLDLNIYAENFYRDLLKIIFDWNLRNINESKQNAEAIDLIDDDKRIIVQVSSTATPDKISKSLSKCLPSYEGYNFKFLSISKETSKLRKKSFPVPSGLIFDPKDDIYDVESILKKINSLNISGKANVFGFFQKSFEPEEFNKLVVRTVASMDQIKMTNEEKNKAKDALKEGKIAEALSILQNAVDKFEKELNEKNISGIYTTIGNIATSLDSSSPNAYFRAIQLNPNNLDAYVCLGHLFYKTGKIKESLSFFERGSALAQEQDIWKIVAEAHSGKGACFLHNGDKDQAICEFNKALEIYKSKDYAKGIVTCYINIGCAQINYEINQAENMFNEALKICEKNNIEHALSSCYTNIAHICEKKDKLDDAILYYRKSVNRDKLNGDLVGLSTNLGNLGKVYVKKGCYWRAMFFHKKALKIDILLNRVTGIAIRHENIGVVYGKCMKFKKAFEHTEIALEINKKSGRILGIANNYKSLGELYRVSGEICKARDFYEKSYISYKKISHPDAEIVKEWMDELPPR